MEARWLEYTDALFQARARSLDTTPQAPCLSHPRPSMRKKKSLGQQGIIEVLCDWIYVLERVVFRIMALDQRLESERHGTIKIIYARMKRICTEKSTQVPFPTESVEHLLISSAKQLSRPSALLGPQSPLSVFYNNLPPSMPFTATQVIQYINLIMLLPFLKFFMDLQRKNFIQQTKSLMICLLSLACSLTLCPQTLLQ